MNLARQEAVLTPLGWRASPWGDGAADPAAPVLPLLGLVDTECAAFVQAVRRAGFRPQLCASPWQVASLAQAEQAELVVVQATAITMSPRLLLQALRLLSPLRVVLAGPEPGCLAHAMALDLGFDEVWPKGLQGASLQTALVRAMAGPSSGSTPGSGGGPGHPAAPAQSRDAVAVDLRSHTCTVAGRVVSLPPDCARLLHSLLLSHPEAMTRPMLARAMGLAVSPALPIGRRIDMTASRLRRKLQQAGLWQLRVSTQWGVGYRVQVSGEASNGNGATSA